MLPMTLSRTFLSMWLLASTLLWSACAADDGEDVAVTPDATVDGVAPSDTGPPDVEVVDTLVLEDVTPGEPISVEVGTTACCLSQSGHRVAWAEGGDVFLYNLETGGKSLLQPTVGVQRDPVLRGDQLVWADDRDGDFDIHIMDLKTGLSELVAGGEGDQVSPSFDGTTVVWIDRTSDALPGSSEIWARNINQDSEGTRLTEDNVEQSFPHVNGSRVVWTDFRNDPDGQYMDPQSTGENNGDIMGFDLSSGEPFVVTEDPGKQLRPAVDGDTVVWLDWRSDGEEPVGIQPEPKYHHFKVYVRHLPEGEEIYLESGGWLQPELWRRPGIHAGHVAWISDSSESNGTQLLVAPIDTGLITVVHESDRVLTGLDFRAGAIAWIGGGSLGWTDDVGLDLNDQ